MVQIHDEIEHRFTYHPPTSESIPKHEAVRAAIKDVAHVVADNTEPGRHQSLALTALQEALIWANCAIVLDPPKGN